MDIEVLVMAIAVADMRERSAARGEHHHLSFARISSVFAYTTREESHSD